MKEKIENKIAEIVDAITAKDPGSVTKDDYDILAAELRRIIYNEEQQEKNKKIAETMGAMLGTGFGSAY